MPKKLLPSFLGSLVLVGILCLGISQIKQADMTESLLYTDEEKSAETGSNSTQTVPFATSITSLPAITDLDDALGVPSYATIALTDPAITVEEVGILLEAEDCSFTGMLEVEAFRYGFSGEGYLGGFACNEGDSVIAMVEVPTTQHYSISICVCADTEVTNALLLDGERVGIFTLSEDDSGSFVRVTFSDLFLESGEHTLSIEEIDGYFALDYFEITSYTEMYDIDYTMPSGLCDSNASDCAVTLMEYLTENYGTAIITGQYASSSSNTELELLYHLTGKYPAIRFGDLESYTQNSTADASDAIAASIAWAERGGIVGLMWYWDAPSGVSSVYASETDFSLSAAIPEDITAASLAKKTSEELDELLEKGSITEECRALLRDIDQVSEALLLLAEEDIAVLWRPLQEASGDWYWWGADGAESYQWLWELLYLRQTEYHGLHNLIWIWNGQSEEYLVDESMYDIASLDIYLSEDSEFSSRSAQFLSLYRMTAGSKLLALSEASSVPNANDMHRDSCIWSFFGLWYGEYLIDSDGYYNESYTTAEEMIILYNSELSLTLEDTADYFLGE